MISDEEIKKRFNAVGIKEGISIIIDGKPHLIPLPVAYRFSMFLDRAILDHFALRPPKGEKKDG